MRGVHARFDTHAILYQDDPSDTDTVSVLRAWTSREQRAHVIESDMGNRGERIQRLVLCRNVLLAETKAILARSKRGGLNLQLDMDCTYTPLLLVGALRRTGYGVLTSNNDGAYRDMWALRSRTLRMNYDCFWDFEQMRRHGNCKHHRIHVSPIAPPFAVDAAFNGAAIYTSNALLERGAPLCRYANETRDPDTGKTHVSCEHVPFQRCLSRQGVRIGLSPSLRVHCGVWRTVRHAKRTFYLPNGSVKIIQ